MPLIPTEKLLQLQKRTESIRNLCILAHVDHGKTTLADSLLAANGIISGRMVGKLRYLDSRPDEQERGITMKSSAVSLYYARNGQEFLVNLIDSPGHVDFCGEVSTAVRLCDGAMVLVDVVEGCCPQTTSLLLQALKQGLKPILVLNKIDRLITELQLTPSEIYRKLQATLEEVNAVAGEIIVTHAMAQHEKLSELRTDSSKNNRKSFEDGNDGQQINGEVTSRDAMNTELDSVESSLYFTPEGGNVVFGSAVDGWGFRLSDFAKIYASKTGVKASVLGRTLWGDYYLDTKQKRIRQGAFDRGKRSLFEQLIVENLISIYDTVLVKKERDLVDKMATSLGIELAARDLKHSDPKVQLRAFMSSWLPLAKTVLEAIVTLLPSPRQMSDKQVDGLLQGSHLRPLSSLPPETLELRPHFQNCDQGSDKPVVAFISKMFGVEKRFLPENRYNPLTQDEIQERRQQMLADKDEKRVRFGEQQEKAENDADSSSGLATDVRTYDADIPLINPGDDYAFIAFARVYSGTLRKGQSLYVLPPTHDPVIALGHGDESKSRQPDVAKVTISDVYLLMGRELEAIDAVPCGNVCGIGGLQDVILKSGTVSSTLACPAFSPLQMYADPIVRVAIEPANLSDMPLLVKGLKLLNQADPCVKTYIQETGERVLVTAGEVHLARCLDDIRQRFSGIELRSSEPIIPYMETIVEPPKVDRVNETIEPYPDPEASISSAIKSNDAVVTMRTANDHLEIQIRARALPEAVAAVLTKHDEVVKLMSSGYAYEGGGGGSGNGALAGVSTEETSVLPSQDRCPPSTSRSALSEDVLARIRELRAELDSAMMAAGQPWSGWVKAGIWAFGPNRARCNLLINNCSDYQRPSLWRLLGLDDEPSSSFSGDKDVVDDSESIERRPQQLRDLDNSVIYGFHLRCAAGPLCDEPIRGVAFVIENWVTVGSAPSQSTVLSTTSTASTEEPSPISAATTSSTTTKDRCGPLSGQIMAIVKEGCKLAFQAQPQRLMIAMYSCMIQAPIEILGKVHSVLGRRRGRVLGEEMRESSHLFHLSATLPVVESFGFAEEIRKKTSGLAWPQLVFSHWEILDIDPFWVPTTEEEYLHFGEKADSENPARKYMNSVRRRKGLNVDEKLVEHAEKQRTLKKNK